MFPRILDKVRRCFLSEYWVEIGEDIVTHDLNVCDDEFATKTKVKSDVNKPAYQRPQLTAKELPIFLKGDKSWMVPQINGTNNQCPLKAESLP
jgi:hypothetical protein